MLTEHGHDRDSAARGWDGDTYALLRGPDDRQALVWYSVWDGAAAADTFADAYRATGIARSVERFGAAGRELVRVVIAGQEIADGALPDLTELEE